MNNHQDAGLAFGDGDQMVLVHRFRNRSEHVRTLY